MANDDLSAPDDDGVCEVIDLYILLASWVIPALRKFYVPLDESPSDYPSLSARLYVWLRYFPVSAQGTTTS